MLRISSLEIVSFPVISIFQINPDNTTKETKTNNKEIAKIFLFLYLFNIKGRPFLPFIFILHLLSLAILATFLNSLTGTLALIIVDFSRFKFSKYIPLSFTNIYKFFNIITFHNYI